MTVRTFPGGYSDSLKSGSDSTSFVACEGGSTIGRSEIIGGGGGVESSPREYSSRKATHLDVSSTSSMWEL